MGIYILFSLTKSFFEFLGAVILGDPTHESDESWVIVPTNGDVGVATKLFHVIICVKYIDNPHPCGRGSGSL